MADETKPDPVRQNLQRFVNITSQAYCEAMGLHGISYRDRCRIDETAKDLMRKRTLEILRG